MVLQIISKIISLCTIIAFILSNISFVDNTKPLFFLFIYHVITIVIVTVCLFKISNSKKSLYVWIFLLLINILLLLMVCSRLSKITHSQTKYTHPIQQKGLPEREGDFGSVR